MSATPSTVLMASDDVDEISKDARPLSPWHSLSSLRAPGCSVRCGAVRCGAVLCCAVQLHLLHDKKALAEVLKTDRANAADAVNGYFGPYVGLYFAWLRFYTR